MGFQQLERYQRLKNGSVVMATGEILGNGNIRYTFTNEIEHKVEVTANLEINLFIDLKLYKAMENKRLLLN